MYLKLIPISLILSLIVCAIDVDLSVPSFPNMAYDFNVTNNSIQLTVAFNFLGFFCGALVYGPLSDWIGRRKVLFIGNLILLLGAIGCLCAHSIVWLTLFRFVQGIGSASSAVVVFAIIGDLYTDHKAMKLIGIINASLTLAITFAPILGSYINQAYGWQGNFVLMIILALIAWIMTFFVLPESRSLAYHFCFKKLKKDFQKLLSNVFFIYLASLPSLLYAAFMSFVTCSSFLYMETFELSAFAYVTNQAMIIGVFSLTSIFSDSYIKTHGAKYGLFIGTFLYTVSSLILMVMSLSSTFSSHLFTLMMCIYSMGFAICYPFLFTSSLEIYPELRGTASSIIMAMRALICSTFISLTSYSYNGHPLTLALIILSCVIICLYITRKVFSIYWHNQ